MIHACEIGRRLSLPMDAFYLSPCLFTILLIVKRIQREDSVLYFITLSPIFPICCSCIARPSLAAGGRLNIQIYFRLPTLELYVS